MAKNKDLKLVIVDQAINQHYLDALREKFSLDENEFQNKVHCFNAKFGSPEAINFIAEKIEKARVGNLNT
ncbi:hypothetical protein ACFLVS_07265 [Chloroflexota bacterium]